jgi:hypothetical protein
MSLRQTHPSSVTEHILVELEEGGVDPQVIARFVDGVLARAKRPRSPPSGPARTAE